MTVVTRRPARRTGRMGRSAYSRERGACRSVAQVSSLTDDAHRVFFDRPDLLASFIAALERVLVPHLAEQPHLVSARRRA